MGIFCWEGFSFGFQLGLGAMGENFFDSNDDVNHFFGSVRLFEQALFILVDPVKKKYRYVATIYKNVHYAYFKTSFLTNLKRFENILVPLFMGYMACNRLFFLLK